MVRWKDAAVQNTVLSAAELYFMAHPDERVPWRQLVSLPPPLPLPTDDHSPSVTPPPPEKWGVRKRRSTKVAPKTAAVVVGKEAEEEKAPGRASPTTPLSWNACEFGAGVRDSRSTRKRLVVGGSVSNGGRGGGGVGDGGRGGGGSIKMAAELKEWERSLLERNKLLKKEVKEQKLAQSMLIEENKRLKCLESKLYHQMVTETSMINAKSEETKYEERQLFPFDLNLPFPVDSEVKTYCSGGCS